MHNLLEGELEAILVACEQVPISIFVVGAYSVRAYDCLLRVSGDLDLAVSNEQWQALKKIIIKQGYSIVTDETLWITALKGFDEGEIEIELNIALNGITDLNSASTFLITEHKPELRQPADLYFPLPVLSLEGVFITKLIAQREKDIADLLSILLLKANHLNSPRFWYEAEESGLIRKLPARLRELVKRIHDGEAMSIWYQHTELIRLFSRKQISPEPTSPLAKKLSRLG
jgi:hypothetical protein